MKTNLDASRKSAQSDCGCQDSDRRGESESGKAGDLAKRRSLLRAGAAAGPVLLALSGKSALANGSVCRFPSTWASVDPAGGGNAAGLSHHPGGGDNCGMGRSPGFWKQAQKRCYWPGPRPTKTSTCNNSTIPSPDSLPCSLGQSPTGAGPDTCSAYHGDGTKINLVLPGASATDQTMQQLLCSNSGSPAWHFAAALLNAHTVLNYPLTPAQVISMWIGTFVVGGVTWTRAQALVYVQTTYDMGDLSDPVFRVGCVPVPCVS